MKKKLIYLVAAVTLMAAVCGVKPMRSGASEPIDLTKPCSMKVYPENPNNPNHPAFGEDLKKAKVVIDVYKVADAKKTAGYDTYSYDLKDDYNSLEIPKKPSTENWEELAQQAAKIALNEEAPKTPEENVSGKAAESKLDLAAGLYLLIARGESLANVKDYKVEVKDENGEPTGEIATVANSSRYQYAFQPQLISLPMRGDGNIAGVPGQDGQLQPGEYGTAADMGPWVYDLNVYLKPGQEQRFGQLKIVKDLLSHESEAGKIDKPVTFVFNIEGKIGDEVVYSNVDSITFTKAGQESVTLDRIPATAEVTVTEVYTGSSYKVVTNGPQTATVAAADVVSVNFENEYDEHNRSGHGIKNQFTYEGSGSAAVQSAGQESSQSGSWKWEKDPVRSTGEGNQ